MNYPYAAQTQSTAAFANAPESQLTPMTRDLNVLGEAISRLEVSLDVLRKSLDPVIRPAPEPAPTTSGSNSPPQLVKAARSSVGGTLERYAAQVESLIERVQYLQSAVEV